MVQWMDAVYNIRQSALKQNQLQRIIYTCKEHLWFPLQTKYNPSNHINSLNRPDTHTALLV